MFETEEKGACVFEVLSRKLVRDDKRARGGDQSLQRRSWCARSCHRAAVVQVVLRGSCVPNDRVLG